MSGRKSIDNRKVNMLQSSVKLPRCLSRAESDISATTELEFFRSDYSGSSKSCSLVCKMGATIKAQTREIRSRNTGNNLLAADDSYWFMLPSLLILRTPLQTKTVIIGLIVAHADI